MKATRETMGLELALQLDALGEERNGKVACVVVFTEDHVEFCWPGLMTQEAIDVVEEAMLDALVREVGDRPPYGPKSR